MTDFILTLDPTKTYDNLLITFKEYYFEVVQEQEDYISAYSLHNMSPTKVGIISVYFAITSLSTCGFGDFVPKTNVERLVCSMMLLFGVAIFSFIMGKFIEML